MDHLRIFLSAILRHRDGICHSPPSKNEDSIDDRSSLAIASSRTARTKRASFGFVLQIPSSGPPGYHARSGRRRKRERRNVVISDGLMRILRFQLDGFGA